MDGVFGICGSYMVDFPASHGKRIESGYRLGEKLIVEMLIDEIMFIFRLGDIGSRSITDRQIRLSSRLAS